MYSLSRKDSLSLQALRVPALILAVHLPLLGSQLLIAGSDACLICLIPFTLQKSLTSTSCWNKNERRGLSIGLHLDIAF